MSLSEKQVSYIFSLAKQYRIAIDLANSNCEFDNSVPFDNFPRGCCGIASCLLANYLYTKDIHTEYVCGNYYYDSISNPQSHAWLTVENIIIDITGDQFKNYPEFLFYDIPVYVGFMDEMHKLFIVEQNDIHSIGLIKNNGPIAAKKLEILYKKIEKYL